MFHDIVWLTGMPRSGTTWISQILASSPDVRVKFCPLFSYAFKNVLDENSTSDQWQRLFEMVYVTEDDFMDQNHLRSKGLVPEFAKKAKPRTLIIKSNRFHNLTGSILQKCPNVRFVSIIRHPCATIHSWITNPLEFPADQDPKKEWRNGSCRKTDAGEFWGFEDWKRVTSLQLRLAQKSPDRFLICQYKNFLKSSLKSSLELFDWLGLEMTQSTRDFIAASQSKHDDHRRSVYKNPSKLNDWKISMSPDIVAEIMAELEGTELEVFLNE